MQISQYGLSSGMACPGLLVDFKTPSSKRTLEALHEEPCRSLLLKFALCRTGSEFDPEDLFSETRDCLCDEETPCATLRTCGASSSCFGSRPRSTWDSTGASSVR